MLSLKANIGKMINKKSSLNMANVFYQQWPQFFFILVLILGFVISVSMQSAVLSYLVIFCGGLITGKLIFSKYGKQPSFPFFLIAIGLLLGYVLGAFKFSRVFIIILFIAGNIIAYYVHKKGYIK